LRARGWRSAPAIAVDHALDALELGAARGFVHEDQLALGVGLAQGFARFDGELGRLGALAVVGAGLGQLVFLGLLFGGFLGFGLGFLLFQLLVLAGRCRTAGSGGWRAAPQPWERCCAAVSGSCSAERLAAAGGR